MDLNECLPTSLPFSLSPVKEIYVQVTFLVLRGYFQVLTTDRATMLLGEKLNFYGIILMRPKLSETWRAKFKLNNM